MSESMGELSGLRIPMRDGAELVADVFLPASPEPRPLILEITPYTRGREALNFSNEADYWVEHGYAFAIVDARGQGDSRAAGAFDMWVHEGRDAFDAIDWLARQPWCSGRVGMRGASYTGTNQWYAAREQPPALKVLVPNATGTGSMDDITYPGGAPHFKWALQWIGGLSDVRPNAAALPDWAALLQHRPPMTADIAGSGRELPLYRQLLSHPLRDDYQRAAEFSTADRAAIDLPALAFSGWFDGTLRGTIAHFRAMRAHSPARDRQWLIVGPWEHISCSDGGYLYFNGEPVLEVGNCSLPMGAMLPGKEITRRFYDAWLRDGPAFDAPRVQLYLTGADRWITGTDFPPPEVRTQTLYLHSGGGANGFGGDGRLAFDAPAQESPDRYRADPTDPVPSPYLRDNRLGPPVPLDLASVLDRDDVLVYTSAPMAAPLTVCGEVELELHVRSDAPDADFIARLEDVAPDGEGMKLGCRYASVLQARSRAGLDREVFLQASVPARLVIRMDAMGHCFRTGHRLRLSVCSSSWPDFFPNPQTGHPRATDTAEPRVAIHEVLHDADHPSHLRLPVLPES